MTALMPLALRTNGLTEPLGLGDATPDFSWSLEGEGWSAYQSAYEIQVDGHWCSGKVASRTTSHVIYGGAPLPSRTRAVWKVRVWDADDVPSLWSAPASFEIGLLTRSDWEAARWIELAGRTDADPLPVFARDFFADHDVRRARLYICGLGVFDAQLNDAAVTDEVLAPGNTNFQRSAEYRTYDVTPLLRTGKNRLVVELGNGVACNTRAGLNPAVGRTDPYAWWTSSTVGEAKLTASAAVGHTAVSLSSTQDFHVGGTINVGGEQLESRTIVQVDERAIAFVPGLSAEHVVGARVTGSGNPRARLDANAGAQITPRLIARLEIAYEDGTSEAVVSDRSWKVAHGPWVTDSWFAGSDYDATREPVWRKAGLAPAPSLATRLVARHAEPIRIQRTLAPVRITRPQADVCVIDFGRNLAGWPELRLPTGVPAGVTLRLTPGEALKDDGTVDQTSLGIGERGTDIFHTYVTTGETVTWRPKFNYFAMRYLQVTGLPVSPEMIRGLQLFADVPGIGEVETSDERINHIHRMAVASIESNTMSTFTDCPGREKLAYGADYVQPIASLASNFDYSAYLRHMQVQLVEAQSVNGDVALKAPVYDYGYAGRFGSDVNWGSAIVHVPWLLHQLYGDTRTMREHFDAMAAYMDFLGRKPVTAPLGDWLASEPTDPALLGTWGHYLAASRMAEMATLTGRDAEPYASSAAELKQEFGRFELTTQTARGVALDAGLVADDGSVLQALVDDIYAYHPHGGGPHLSSGHIGLGPVVRALLDGGRSDVLWDVLQENTPPSYGHFIARGLTSIPERWDCEKSLNHMILLQIEEWFHAGLGGIRRANGELIIRPTLVGNLTHVRARSFGVRSEWWGDAEGITRLEVEVPANVRAKVYLDGQIHDVAPGVAVFE